MGDPQRAIRTLSLIRDLGVRFAIDDFGTGYSSLSHLHKLPVDALKIDRSFVRSLLLPERPAIVQSILALARTLKTGVVAEGVESAMQAQELKPWPGVITPALSLSDLEGKPHKLADYRGKVVLVNFWATWCVPCREEMPSIERLRASYA